MEREDDLKQPVDFVEQAKTTREVLTGDMAQLLIRALLVSIILHYGTIGVLEWNGKTAAVESLSRVFQIWLPVLSGFVGSAVTFYFRQDTSGRK